MIADKSTEKSKPPGLSSRWPRPGVALFVACYAVALFLLSGIRPLWLDEVVQLTVTRRASLRLLLEGVRDNAGGAPLGYLGQYWLMAAAGTGLLTARFLSVLAGAASLAALLFLCRKLGLSRSATALSASLWMVCPLILRYSTEGRPYMQALLFALLSALSQIELRDTRKTVWAIAATACLAAALYSQPFAVFAPAGFALCSVWQQRDRRYTTLTCASYIIAGLSFLPWALSAQSRWAAATARVQGGFELGPALAVLLREFMGDGYFAAVPVILLAAYAARDYVSRRRNHPRMPLLAAVAAGLALVLSADSVFKYFFAVRQVIYVVPFVLIMAAEGAATVWRRRPVAAAILIGVFLSASAAKSYRYMSDGNEDWDRLSHSLIRAADAGCILLPAGDDAANYVVLRPGVAYRLCGENLSSRIVVPVHPYTNPRALETARRALFAAHMSRLSVEQAGFATVEVFEKR